MTFFGPFRAAALVLGLSALGACGDSGPAGGSAAGGNDEGGNGNAGGNDGGAPAGGAGACADVKGYSELTAAFSKCTSCHSTELVTAVERQAAPLGYDYDTYEVATQHLPETKQAIESGQEPFAPAPALTPTEKADILLWIDCGAPE